MPEETYNIELSAQAEKLIDKHECLTGHIVESYAMRRRLSYEDAPLDKAPPGNVVYWLWHLCDCGWDCMGRVSMRNESAQQEFSLPGCDE